MANERGDIYSITGTFVQDRNPRQTYFFGGFFYLANDSNMQGRNLPLSLVGGIVDIYGHSNINGLMGESSLSFSKRYPNGKLFQYKFNRTENGIWVGDYSLVSKPTVKGKAVAKTNLDWKGIEMTPPEGRDPEGWSKDLLEQMINEGMLELVPEEPR